MMGLIVGLMVGLAVALGVALYVTKVPVPFVNKVPQRTAEQDAAEAEKNKNWDPNAPLHSKGASKPVMNPASGAPASQATAPQPAPQANPPQTGSVTAPPVATAPTMSRPAAPRRDPADILANKPSQDASPTTDAPARAGADTFSFYVQVGAYAHPEDADAQRAKLAMMGMGARITERDQGGRTMYRVRVGPFDHKEEADSAKEKLDAAGIETSLVRVQR